MDVSNNTSWSFFHKLTSGNVRLHFEEMKRNADACTTLGRFSKARKWILSHGEGIKEKGIALHEKAFKEGQIVIRDRRFILLYTIKKTSDASR